MHQLFAVVKEPVLQLSRGNNTPKVWPLMAVINQAQYSSLAFASKFPSTTLCNVFPIEILAIETKTFRCILLRIDYIYFIPNWNIQFAVNFRTPINNIILQSRIMKYLQNRTLRTVQYMYNG